MRILLRSGNYDIIANGETYLFQNSDDFAIQISDDAGWDLSIVLSFIDDSGEMDIRSEVEEDTLIISCLNFNGRNMGLKQPTHIADVDNRALYLMFTTDLVVKNGYKIRSVKYTIFLEKIEKT